MKFRHRVSSTRLVLAFCFHALVSIWRTDTVLWWEREGKCVTLAVQHVLREQEEVVN